MTGITKHTDVLRGLTPLDHLTPLKHTSVLRTSGASVMGLLPDDINAMFVSTKGCAIRFSFNNMWQEKDGSRVTPVTAATDVVGEAGDLQTHNTAINGFGLTDAKRMLASTPNDIESMGVLNTGKQMRIDGGTGWDITQPCTVIVIGERLSIIDSVYQNDVLGSNAGAVGTQVGVSDAAGYFLYAGTTLTGGTATTGQKIYESYYDGASSLLKVDGSNEIADDAGAGAACDFFDLASYGASVFPNDFAFQAIVIINRAITSDERTALNTWKTDIAAGLR